MPNFSCEGSALKSSKGPLRQLESMRFCETRDHTTPALRGGFPLVGDVFNNQDTSLVGGGPYCRWMSRTIVVSAVSPDATSPASRASLTAFLRQPCA
jgi:hypothetical protein